MVDISKLMIGNLLKYKKGHLAVVTGITENDYITVTGIESNYISGTYHIRDWDYIPINMEIRDLLRELDFSYINEKSFSTKGHFRHQTLDISILIETTPHSKNITIIDNVRLATKKVTYLNDIQNYFNIEHTPLKTIAELTNY